MHRPCHYRPCTGCRSTQLSQRIQTCRNPSKRTGEFQAQLYDESGDYFEPIAESPKRVGKRTKVERDEA